MNIYVGNLPHAVNEEELKSLFEEFGEVSSAKVIKDKFTGQSRGFAFVEMASEDEANAAIDGMNGREVSGRNLRVNKAREREARRPHSGGRGRNSSWR